MLIMKMEYLEKVKKALGSYQNSLEAYNEIFSHIEEAAKEKMLTGICEHDAYKAVFHELGDPIELVRSFYPTSEKSQKPIYFILLNWCFFFIGSFLTVGHRVFDFWLIHNTWMVLENLSLLLLLSYSFYWFYLGFVFGKQFGPKGKRIVNRMILWSLLPNFILMTLVLLNILPKDYFATLLSPMFLLLCVITTMLYYPISQLAYKFGIVNGL